ncbi:MAG: class I SAM-dependent methyltransferase [candidate division WOR-3 bacterium]|nr:MAG: class I SAM-dependent methyltransferase [candidate division WOR-3 bacterium]
MLLRGYEHPKSLTVLGVDDYSRLREKHPGVRFVTCRGGYFPFADDSFDICYSNAVIEHVGEREDQRQFIGEMVRVARQGFFTTPNRWLPLEVHTRLPAVHYLPRRYFWKVAQAFGRGDSARGVNLIRLGLLKKMMKCSRVKHFPIIPNRVWGMTATYSVCWTRS